MLAILPLPVARARHDIERGAEEASRLPWDVENFFFYWQDYGITRITVFHWPQKYLVTWNRSFGGHHLPVRYCFSLA